MKKVLGLALLLLLPAWGMATSPEDFYNAGVDLFNSHDYEKAIQYFHAAVDERPDYWQAYQSLGMAYYQNGNITEGLMAMEKSLQLHSDNPKLREFISKIKNDSPWAAKGFSTGVLPVFAILLSLLNLGWMGYLTWRLKIFKSKSPPQS
jgi:tetratricopeptide (TPR) repeat protein